MKTHFRCPFSTAISDVDTYVLIWHFDTFRYLHIIGNLYRQFLHRKLLLNQNLQFSNHRFKRIKMRYRKLVCVLILLDTSSRYRHFSVPYFDTQLKKRYFSIPHHDTNFRHRYQDIDTSINTSDTRNHK